MTLLLGGVEVHVCPSPKKMFKFMASEVTSGNFLGPRSLVADILKYPPPPRMNL